MKIPRVLLTTLLLSVSSLSFGAMGQSPAAEGAVAAKSWGWNPENDNGQTVADHRDHRYGKHYGTRHKGDKYSHRKGHRYHSHRHGYHSYKWKRKWGHHHNWRPYPWHYRPYPQRHHYYNSKYRNSKYPHHDGRWSFGVIWSYP